MARERGASLPTSDPEPRAVPTVTIRYVGGRAILRAGDRGAVIRCLWRRPASLVERWGDSAPRFEVEFAGWGFAGDSPTCQPPTLLVAANDSRDAVRRVVNAAILAIGELAA